LLHGRDLGQPADQAERQVADAVRHWGKQSITEAFGLLIYTIMNVVKPPPGGEDALHLVVPAVLSKFHQMNMPEVPDDALPTVAGLLTAAFFGQAPYDWRTNLGPIPDREVLVWWYTAWLLVDLMDNAVFDNPGQFVRLLAGALALDEADDAD
jgi:hypothetical protein